MVECHPIAGESLADEAESSLPYNLSAQVNAADWQVLGITRGPNAPVAAAALVIMGGWGLLCQGFMRALVIVMAQPARRARGLAGRMGCRPQRWFRFEHPMPLFIGTVIFGMAPPGD